MSDLPESLRRAHRAATSRVQSGPQNAIRATSPASPYARDRIEAPSNRPAPRTPTLRSQAQDVIRSAPGALSAARERQVYDTTWEDVGRGAQELTGLPSLARGAGGLAALPALARSGFLGADHALPIAGAVAETALGLAGPMSLPRGALRAPTAEAVSPFGRQITGRTSEYMNEVRRLPRLSGRARQAFAEAQGTAGVVETIPFSQLSTYQDVINPDFVAAAARHTPDDMPRVYRYRGKNYVMDGNHRLAATAGTGVDSAQVRVYDLDARLRGEPAPQGPVRESQAAFGPNGQPVEPAQRIPNMAREIGPNGMPIAQSQPYRNSLRGGSADLREAAAPPQSVVARPPPAPPATPSLPSGVAMEGRNRGAGGLARYRYTDSNRPGFTYDFVVEPDAASRGGMASIQMQPMYNGQHVPMNEIVGEGTAQDAFSVYNALQETLLADARAFNRPGYYITGAGRLRDFHERLAERAFKRGALPEGYQFIPRDARNSARVVLGDRPQIAPPPTTPTGTAPFGDPRAYPPSAWEEFGSAPDSLPMDQASRMERAREGQRYYHATRSDITQFSPSSQGAQGPGTYLSRDPDRFAHLAADEGGNIMPLTVRGRMADPAEFRGMVESRFGPQNWPELSPPQGMSASQFNREYEALRREWRERAQARGDIGLDEDPDSMMGAVVFPGQEHNIRSIFAAFDPSKRDSSDLLAITNDPGGIGPGSVPPLAPPSTSDSVAMRMARAERMGFDTRPFYHGSPDARQVRERGGFERRTQNAGYLTDPERYAAIQSEMAAERAANGTSERYFELLNEATALNQHVEAPRPIYLSDNEGIARSYARDDRAFDYQGAEPAVMPLHTRGNLMVVDGGGERFANMSIDRIRASLPESRRADFDAMVARYKADFTGNPGRITTNDLEAIAHGMGFDGFEVRNVRDTYQGQGAPSTVRAIFDPSNLRSPGAAFDPSKSGSSDLLALTNDVAADPMVNRSGALRGFSESGPRLTTPGSEDRYIFGRPPEWSQSITPRRRLPDPPPPEGPPSLVDLVDDGGGNLIVGAMRRAGVNIQRAEDSGLLDRPMTQRQIPITQLRGTDHTRPAREWVDMFKEDPSEFYPIQVRQRGRNRYDIIDGHHRTQAAREMGQTEIDAYDASLYFPEIRNRWALGAPLAAVPPSGSALTQQQNTTGRPRGRPGFFGGR